jgi:LysR family transcriptional regulator, transcriptional activator for aaeXAB operon
MTSIANLTYELSVLAKAVHYKNLSSAANFVGLSQPQLSRLVHKIEEELKVVLLDRSSRRTSGWTDEAQNLIVAFQRGMSRLESEVLSVTLNREQSEIKIGTLEGLSEIAMTYTRQFFDTLKMRKVFLDVFDYTELDSLFLGGQLDLIFTARTPSKQKFRFQAEVGYQQMEKIESSSRTHVVSPFEFGQAIAVDEAKYERILISNSLQVRRHWLRELGGTGALPVDAKRGRGKGYYSIMMIANDLLPMKLWEQIAKMNV